MRWRNWIFLTLVMFFLGSVGTLQAGSVKIFKVLPHYLDKEGRHTLSPSPFERDRYQAILKADPEKCSTMRFDIQWRNTLKDFQNIRLKIELRGSNLRSKPIEFTEEFAVNKSIWSKWSKIKVPEEVFEKLHNVSAWRVSIWDGEEMICEYQSFLWDPQPDPSLIRREK